MLSKSETDWLNSSIEELPFSTDFKAMARDNKLGILKDVMDTEIPDLLKFPGFNYHCLHEFVQFLEKRKMAYLLRH